MSAGRTVAPRLISRPVHRTLPSIGLCTRARQVHPRVINANLHCLAAKTVKPLSFRCSIRIPHAAPPNLQQQSHAMATVAVPPSQEAIAQLQRYTSCDISDALLKLKVPKAGFIADLNPYHSGAEEAAAAVTVAPVSTVLFTPKDEDASAGVERPAPNFPKDTHWVDNAVPGTFAVLQQPAGQTNAICGGIMALRMKVLGVKGIIVAGRVRDLLELRSTELPVRIPSRLFCL